MIAEGRTGRKGKGGFYTMKRDGAARTKLSIDLATGDYRPEQKPRLASLDEAGRELSKLADHPDRGGKYARALLLDTLSYAASLVPEIADDIEAVDAAMRLGYNWKDGPFALIDRVGPAWLAAALRADGREVPKFLDLVGQGKFYRTDNGQLQIFGTDGQYHNVVRAPGVLLLADIKRRSKPLAKNGSASLWDIGDDVACLEFTSKMNSLDPDIMALISRAITMGKKGAFKALVIYNEGSQFSVGANLGLAIFAANIAAWGEIENLVEAGQKTYRALRDAPFPVVSAPSGMALGGGCEVLLHSDAVQAHAETYTGLVEVGVGLIPGWGGTTTLLKRWAANKKFPRGPMPAVSKAFEIISTAQVSKSAAEAQDLLLLKPTDGITMNRDRLLADAKAKALSLVEGYAPPEPVTLKLPGAAGRAALKMAVDGFAATGKATPHDVVVCEALAQILTGGPADPIEDTTEDKLYALERSVFMQLVRHPASLARIEHMLESGKPLRN